MKKIRKIFIISIILVITIYAITFLTDTTYVYKSLLYNFAEVNDYIIFENRKVKAGNPQPFPISVHYNTKKIPEDLHKELKKLKTFAFLVVKDDSIVYEQYWEGYSHISYSNSFSIAKSITSILTGIALKEGKIKSLDEPVGNYLTEFMRGKKAKITIRHLLTMTSGLNWQESYMLPISHTTEAYYGNDLKKLVGKLKVEKEPGTVFRYKSGDAQILGLVLNKATGTTLSEYAGKKLWTVIGANQDALWSIDREGGYEKNYCCFNSNARDLARIGLLYLHKGKWGEEQVVPGQYVFNSIQPVILSTNNRKQVPYYGYSWWLLPKYEKEGIFYARGILGQYIIVVPSKNIVIVRLGHCRGEPRGNHWSDIYAMIDGVLKTF